MCVYVMRMEADGPGKAKHTTTRIAEAELTERKYENHRAPPARFLSLSHTCIRPIKQRILFQQTQSRRPRPQTTNFLARYFLLGSIHRIDRQLRPIRRRSYPRCAQHDRFHQHSRVHHQACLRGMLQYCECR